MAQALKNIMSGSLDKKREEKMASIGKQKMASFPHYYV
jgi:hypothetical protein